jgi:hypothetical protein
MELDLVVNAKNTRETNAQERAILRFINFILQENI